MAFSYRVARLPAFRRDSWTEHEIEVAARMWQSLIVDLYDEDEFTDGAKQRAWVLIAKEVNKELRTVKNRYVAYGASFRPPIRYGKDTPLHVLAERDARGAASELRDLTAGLCGDPPPGYSALERRGL